MTENSLTFRVDGRVERPADFDFAQLQQLPAEYQIPDVSQVVPGRTGGAVRLAGLLDQVQPQSDARFIGLHASRDDFHASVPLDAIREQAILIYARDGRPLSAEQGGPVRLFIPDHAECQADEVDECANVKFIDHIELTAERGFDNRPQDEDEHAELHARQPESDT